MAYDSVEEGFSQSIKDAMIRTNMQEVGGKLLLLDKEGIPELKERLARKKSPEVVIVDSIQFMGLQFAEYKELKQMFPGKLFIWISHVEGKLPDGNTARRVWRDANIAFRIEGFRAFPVGRYGGGEPYTISEEKAAAYWMVDGMRQA